MFENRLKPHNVENSIQEFELLRKAYLTRIIFNKLIGLRDSYHFDNLVEIAINKEKTLFEFFGEIHDKQNCKEYPWIENHLEIIETLCYYFLYGNGELEHKFTNEGQRSRAIKNAYKYMKEYGESDYNLESYVRKQNI